MSGTEPTPTNGDPLRNLSEGLASSPVFENDESLTRVWRTLNREDPIDALGILSRSVKSPDALAVKAGARVALGFDTNALLRIGLGQTGADSLDYLRTQHKGPVIIPGQTIQEIWTNQPAASGPLAKVLKQKFEELETELSKIDVRFGASGDRVNDELQTLIAEYGHVVDPESNEALAGTLDVFLAIAEVSYVPRVQFAELAEVREQTKTPPGFRDAGHGDFFLWADFMHGLARIAPTSIDVALLVTNDKKLDWSRDGVPHPLLVAEASALAGVPFGLWTLRDFQSFVQTGALRDQPEAGGGET